MTPQEIKSALTFNLGTVPIDAMREALAQREAMTPIFLAELERMADAHEGLLDEQESYIFHIMAMFLLAQFRETRALAPLVRICHLPVDDLDFLLEDIINESLGNILASVCGNDLASVKSIIENRELDPFVRGAGLSALATLYSEEALTRESLVNYLRDVSRTFETDPEMWTLWAQIAYDIWPAELMPQIRAAFDEDLIDNMLAELSEFEDVVLQGQEATLTDLRRLYQYVTDPAETLERWGCFRGGWDYEPEPDILDDALHMPYFRETPKVGRNDPCPCGSGKKYKKCCMPG
jgi:hypothetical protein